MYPNTTENKFIKNKIKRKTLGVGGKYNKTTKMIIDALRFSLQRFWIYSELSF